MKRNLAIHMQIQLLTIPLFCQVDHPCNDSIIALIMVQLLMMFEFQLTKRNNKNVEKLKNTQVLVYALGFSVHYKQINSEC